jgi:hypothetical protein
MIADYEKYQLAYMEFQWGLSMYMMHTISWTQKHKEEKHNTFLEALASLDLGLSLTLSDILRVWYSVTLFTMSSPN